MKRGKKRNMKNITAKQILCRLLAAAAALVLLLSVIPGFGEEAETAGAPAESGLPLDDIRSCLWPLPDDEKKIVDDLVPLDLSCEDKGIRLEIIAGAVKEQQALFVYSLQDLDENRENKRSSSIVKFDISGGYSRGHYLYMYEDQAARKKTYAAYLNFDTPAGFPETITASLPSQEVMHTSSLFIQGMLEKYGGKADLVDVPEILPSAIKEYTWDIPEYYTTEDYRNAGVKVLDYSSPLSVRLHKYLELSGIAVVDGQLHVQLRCHRDAHHSWPTSLHSIYDVNVACGFNGEYMPWGSWMDSVSWSVGGDALFPEYHEFIFPWNPKEGDRPVIRVQYTEVVEEIAGSWKVDFPLADVWKGSVPLAEASAYAPEAAPAADPASYDWQDELEARLRGEPADLRVLAAKLVPAHAVCESEGIRFELISAAINETAGLAVYSVEDLEGNRVNDLSYPIVNVISPIDDRQHMFTLHYDEAAGKAVFAAHFRTDGKKALDSGLALRLESGALDVYHRSGQSILGLLQKYGSRAKLVDVPEIQERYVKSTGPKGSEFYTTEDLRKAGVKVLDYQDPLSVRLHKHLELSGIGVVDGELHVQVHYIDNRSLETGGSWHSPIQLVDVSRTVNGMDDFVHGWENDVVWNVSNGNWPDFQEFIAPWDELAGSQLGIKVYITELVDVVNGKWTVEIPVQDIWVGESVPAGE